MPHLILKCKNTFHVRFRLPYFRDLYGSKFPEIFLTIDENYNRFDNHF